MKTKDINLRLKRVYERFGSHIGTLSSIRQEYPQILRPAGIQKDGTGFIMSYNEALTRLKRATHPDIDISYFTKDFYEMEVQRFYMEQKEHLYIRSEMKIKRERLENVVADAFEYMGVEYDEEMIKKIPYDELKQIVTEANHLYSDKYKDTTDSPKFYERIVYSIMGNGDAETE